MRRWSILGEEGRRSYRLATTFLSGRLDSRETIEWALSLKSSDESKKLALSDLVEGPEGAKIAEPWRTAWRLIQESWERPFSNDRSQSRAYHIKHQLTAGDTSGIVVKDIAELVAPNIKIERASSWVAASKKSPKIISRYDQLFSVTLTSGKLVEPRALGLPSVREINFLIELANSVESEVLRGLDIARRLGWESENQLWRLGQLHRVYYVPKDQWIEGGQEPDEFCRGIAPSVKMLHFVVSQLANCGSPAAIEHTSKWRNSSSSIFIRLWASLALRPQIATSHEVADFLLSLDDRLFWNQNENPEISELRAHRFNELCSSHQALIVRRIRKRPPRSQWPRKADASRVDSARKFWAVRELRRIELAGGVLATDVANWVSGELDRFPELGSMSRVSDGFLGGVSVRWSSTKPDIQYDEMRGTERLHSLELALGTDRGGWEDHPAEAARAWIRQPGSQREIITDLERATSGGALYPKVWNALGWEHAPRSEDGGNLHEGARVLALMSNLPDAVLSSAIDGVTYWLSAWEKHIQVASSSVMIWMRLWPIAVEATNNKPEYSEQDDLQTVARPTSDREPMDLDTLNTPAGRLVGVFLSNCPSLSSGDVPFENDKSLKAMRDKVVVAPGRAGLIARHRMIEHLPYFLQADSEWTKAHLIEPLKRDDPESVALWRAVARRTRFTEVLKIIGAAMADRIGDARLGRESRQALVFSLVVECLSAFFEKREPAVSHARVQQLIRSLDDEVRAHAAGAIQQYVREMSSKTDGPNASTAAEVFNRAAKPFLREVWPQERSLAAPGVSRALADLPATAQDTFADAVDAIERFLVPFDCWSLLDYGLYGEDEGEPKLANIDSAEKADALLRLLNLTIGEEDDSVVPMDLSDALQQVRVVAPNLVEGAIFRRLSTLARRN